MSNHAVAQQVQQGIEEGVDAQHAPKARQRGQPRRQAQRGHGQGQAQQAQRPVAHGADQRLGRVGAQAVERRRVHQPGQRQQAQHEQQRLGRRVPQRPVRRGLAAGARLPHQ